MSLLALALLTGWATSDPAKIAKGREVYETACLLCHGRDGASNPEWESPVRPVPFSDCGTTAEPTALWKSIVANGGPKHGLSDVMPAFGEAFAEPEIDAVVAYLRAFCATADRYPPGDLNFRRLLATGKAFPEAEVVIQSKVVPKEGETELEFVYENRLGPRFQYEIELPLRPAATNEGYGAGAGDLVASGKYVLSFDRARGRILSAGIEASLPTGSERKRLGAGTPVFTPFLAYGQALGSAAIQVRLGQDLPKDSNRAARAFTYALGASLPPIGFSRTGYVPSVELVGAYNHGSGNHSQTLVLGLSKALNRLGHVIASAGWGIPLRPSGAPRPKEFRAYLVWDFGDGPFWTGW